MNQISNKRNRLKQNKNRIAKFIENIVEILSKQNYLTA